jgi:hypothetical protein
LYVCALCGAFGVHGAWASHAHVWSFIRRAADHGGWRIPRELGSVSHPKAAKHGNVRSYVRIACATSSGRDRTTLLLRIRDGQRAEPRHMLSSRTCAAFCPPSSDLTLRGPSEATRLHRPPRASDMMPPDHRAMSSAACPRGPLRSDRSENGVRRWRARRQGDGVGPSGVGLRIPPVAARPSLQVRCMTPTHVRRHVVPTACRLRTCHPPPGAHVTAPPSRD